MKRPHLLSTAAFGLAALLAAPALAQGRGSTAGAGDVPSAAPTAQSRATAEADRMHGGNGTNGGPAELLRSAQGAMRNGQTAQANELLERAETRLLTGAEPAKPAGSAPAVHVAEARRALTGRDRAEAMRHTNMAIATIRDGGDATGSDPAGTGSASEGGGPGAGRSGAGAPPSPGVGSAVLRDGGTGATSVSRAEGVVLAQSTGTGPGGTGATTGRGGGGRPPPTGMPPGDSLPGWSGSRGGAAAPPSGTAPQATPPGGLSANPGLGGNTRGGGMTSGPPAMNSGPSSSDMIGGEPARIGGAPPSDTTRSLGSSGLSGAGVGGSGVGGPIR